MSFFENTRKPVGLGGKLMVAMMNLGHSPVAQWGLRSLRLAPNAKVLDCGCASGNYDSFYSLRKKPMKCKIEKNTVQETLILPLYSRKLCTELYPNLYRDETAVRLLDQIDYDFSEAEKNSRSLMQRFGALEVAMRQSDLAFEVRDYLKGHPNAAVVNLGCGLDNTGRTCDNGRCKIYNLDFPDVIALRQQLLPAGDREHNIPCDLKDTAWFGKIDASGGAVFFASGVFYYFLTQEVRELVRGMADAFPDGVLVFDAANRTAVKMIAKTWLKTAKIKDVGAYFAVSDAAKEISTWDSRLQVTSRGYMLGYNDLRDPSVSGFFRFLARVGDNGMKMQKTSASCRPIGKKRSSFLNALYGGESASYASALLASSAAPRIPWSPPQPGAQM